MRHLGLFTAFISHCLAKGSLNSLEKNVSKALPALQLKIYCKKIDKRMGGFVTSQGTKWMHNMHSQQHTLHNIWTKLDAWLLSATLSNICWGMQGKSQLVSEWGPEFFILALERSSSLDSSIEKEIDKPNRVGGKTKAGMAHPKCLSECSSTDLTTAPRSHYRLARCSQAAQIAFQGYVCWHLYDTRNIPWTGSLSESTSRYISGSNHCYIQIWLEDQKDQNCK